MTHQDDLKKLIYHHNRRLQLLKEQQALRGFSTPPEIVIEIETIEAELKELDVALKVATDEVETGFQISDLADLTKQLALFETAQQGAPDPRRFQTKINELKHIIAHWEGRIETQSQRIADGLAELRQSSPQTQQHFDKKHLQVVGRRPLGEVEHFKNRYRERETIGQLLAEPGTRLVSIIGHGGMGKTALVSKILGDLERHRWPHTDSGLPLDGIVYLSTRTTGISLERLFLDCAKLLGGDQEKYLITLWTNPQLATEDKVCSLLEALQDGLYVILLDNLEDLLDDQGQLVDKDLRIFFEHSMSMTHGARLLVTSRLALTFKREVMHFDQQVKLLDGLPVEDGVALLRELDPNGNYGLRDAPPEQLAQAVLLVHGVPRALEVIAGLLANDPFITLVEVMQQFYAREDVVHDVIEENYKRLDSNARRVIEALAVFRRPVPPLAVDYLLKPFGPGLDVPRILQRLTHTNIISVDRISKTVTLHPIDQDCAYSQLPEEENADLVYTRQALERRAADYYAQFRTPAETWKTIDDLEPQLAEFDHRIRAGDYDEACQLLLTIDAGYLQRWGHYTRLTELHQSLLGHLSQPALKMHNLGRLGSVCCELGQLEQAVQFSEQALAIAREIKDRRNEGIWLSNLGFAHRFRGQVDLAIKLYQEALLITRELGQRQDECVLLGRLGVAYRFVGQIEPAIKAYEESITIAREIGNREEEGYQLGRLGIAYLDLGKVVQAIKFYEEALAIAREIGFRQNEVIWLNNLGQAHRMLEKSAQACEFYEQALTIAQEIGYRLGQGYQLLGLSKSLLDLGKAAEAQQRCREARDLDVPEISYQAALVFGITLLHQQDNLAAREAFVDTSARCQVILARTADLYEVRYCLATAMVGVAVCDPRWAEENQRGELLAPALAEYRRAVEISAQPRVVDEARRNLGLIRKLDIPGLEPAFELLSVGASS